MKENKGQRRARPWEDFVPGALALQLGIALAAAELAERKRRNPHEAWTAPERGLIKAGAEAARVVAEYAVGRPVTRFEERPPSDLRR